MPPHEELLDIKQAAEFLNVSETSLRRWTNAGRLPCLRVGHRRERRFRRADLLAFMEVENGDSRASIVVPGIPARDTATIGGVHVPHGAHLLGFYTSDSGRSKLTVSFLAGGLSLRSACVVFVAPKARRGIMQQLRASHPSADEDIKSGRLAFEELPRTIAELYENLESTFDVVLRAGAVSIRFVGDASTLAETVGLDGVLEYERVLERRIAERFPVVTLCLYDVRQFSSAELFGALKGHRDVFRYPVEWSLS
jgi:transcriptional repressor of dcmA and dcmR